MKQIHKEMVWIAAALLYAFPQAAIAGPSFFTDDPEPVDYQHWEINTAIQSTHGRDNTYGAA